MDSMAIQTTCFGKLPQFADFVRYNSGGQEVRVFEDWLQEGLFLAMKHFDREWPRIYDASPAYHFMFCPQETDRCLLGMFRPSRDQSGRRYPFVIAMRSGRPSHQNHPLPVGLSWILKRITPQFDLAYGAAEIQEITNNIGALNQTEESETSACIRDYFEYLKSTRQADFWNQVMGGDSLHNRYRLVKNLLEIVTPLRGHPPQRLSLGLRFPVGNQPDLIHRQVGFWIQMVERMFGNSLRDATAFWGRTGDGQANFLFLFLKRPGPRSLISLIRPDLEDDALCQLEVEGKAVSAWDDLDLEPEIKSVFSDEARSLDEVLQLV